MEKEHYYNATVVWTGNKGEGTTNYRSYDRDHIISVKGKPDIPGSSDPAFRGSTARYNPEEMLVASLSTCHMLWYLHLCAVNQVVVTEYRDEARGIMLETDDGGGRFKEVVLYPLVTVSEAAMQERAAKLHHEAHRLCYIANSVNFPVRHEPSARVAKSGC
jgi:organic hydroperoxide reductase OsmC/OhrA